MTSENLSQSQEAFVWIWLPEQTEPIVAGKLQYVNNRLFFNYGKSYLERRHEDPASIALYEPELPLQSGILPLAPGLSMPSCIRDASPDAWGRRVIINKLLGLKGATNDTAILNEITYLLASGSDRIGALDFQMSPSEYVPRLSGHASLEELQTAAICVEKGIPLNSTINDALFHASSIGGARPKALIESNHKKYIAKFSSSSDLYNIVKIEYVAMRLAKMVGLKVANTQLTQAAQRDVLLIERFDRVNTQNGWTRKAMVSALTLLGLDDMSARYASYETLAEIIRHRFINPKASLKELFSRLVFNILCGNTDDHARNHAAFWDGKQLELTPAYDICPQARTGNEASQAMLIIGDNNLSQLKNCLATAHNYLLSESQANEIISHQIATITKHWDSVCDEATLSEIDRQLIWKRQFLNEFVLE